MPSHARILRRLRLYKCNNPFNTSRGKGFTLLEIVVVVFIIGIVLSLVVISFKPNKGRELKTEADRFMTLVSLATQESILLSKDFALQLSREGYSFLTLQDQQWVTVDDDTFRERNLPKGDYMDVYLEGEKLDFDTSDNKDDEEKNHPRIFLLSSGEMTPFEVIFRSDDISDSFHITGDMSGKLSMEEQQ